ncbi:caspase family protein [Sphingobium sp. AN558]|uniref:caspase family protein n=1 Tax=Sphingobium sp. AN558 TaxID=3133442 RepID=UPI0030BC9488
MSKWQRGLWVTVLTAFVTIFLDPGYARAETRALLVGSWKFHSSLIMDLAGPENDLAAMETLIRGQGATDVTVLRNDGVSRTAVETALHALGLRAKPGDWIFLYYTGHGALAEATVKGTRDGDTDQFLPLPGFDPDHEDPERYIVDKDFYNWLARYVPRDVQVLMMADACHSGTMHRSVDPRAMGMTPRLTLAGRNVALTSRPAPRFASVLASADNAGIAATREDLPNLFYLSAAKDDQVAWENALPAEGAPSRGFLTWSFEQGMTTVGANGKTWAADQNGDGVVSVGELGAYLNVQVRALSGQRQESNLVIPAGRDGQGIFATVLPSPRPPAPPLLPGLYVADIKARAAVTGDFPWRVLTDGKGADFVWDAGKQVMLRRTGDMVAQNVKTLSQVRGVMDNWAAMEALRPLLSEQQARVMIGPLENGARYASGAPVTLALGSSSAPAGPGRERFATIFNVASDGTVQRLYPTVPADGNGKLQPGQTLPILESQVIAPYGTDHVIALITPHPPEEFRLMLRTAENQRSVGRLVAPIKDLLAASPGQASLSIGELYTGN